MKRKRVYAPLPSGRCKVAPEFAAQCHIKNIIAKYNATGMVSHLNRLKPRYDDVSWTPDLLESFYMVDRANELFMALSSDVRAKFGNSAEEFVSFASDPKNYDEMIRMGFVDMDKPVKEEKKDASLPQTK